MNSGPAKKAAATSPSKETQSTTLRIRTAHLEALEKIAERKGVIRSAVIQLAVSEYIERNRT